VRSNSDFSIEIEKRQRESRDNSKVVQLSTKDDLNVPVITIEPGELDRLASEGEAALIAANVDFYTRGGQVVRPIIDEVDASKGRKTKAARLVPVSEATMLDYLCRHSLWEKYDKKTAQSARANPPHSVARIILARDGEWNFKPLAGVITAPTMRWCFLIRRRCRPSSQSLHATMLSMPSPCSRTC
jgi:hypothetical protein